MTDNDVSDLFSDVSDMSYTSDLDLPCNSISYDISNGSPIDTNKFIMLHYNINSITAEGRLDELHDICQTLKVSVLCITESKLDETIPNNIIKLFGFHEPLRRDRPLNGRNGGGCLVYIADNLIFNQQTNLQSENFHPFLTYKISLFL